uniref:Translin n=1 Tax=Hyaloperonospora arabidopsidis (strain Emoy2) TaxID=559515 RepID=M4BYQ6_HYAAE
MHEHDEMREQIIKRSRKILKASTTSTIHQVYYVTIDQVIPELVALAKRHPSLRDGALAASLEEYVEAKCLGYYLDHQRLLPRRDVPVVQKNEYLGGVIDFTGELMRLAVVKATVRDVEEVKRCKAMVEAISGELIQFDFRNGPLRRKFDSVKYNLRKLENTLYELSLVTNSGLTLHVHSVQEEPDASTREDCE